MRRFVAAAVLCLPLLSVAVSAGKPPTATSVTATFRCPTTADCVVPDRIAGDPARPYVGNLTTMLGAFLNSANNFEFQLANSGNQQLFLDFREPANTAPCAASGSCRRSGGYFFDMVTTYSTAPAPAIVNPVDANGASLPNGFLDVPIGGTRNAKFKINFPDPAGRAMVWTVRFNPTEYPGSSYVSVTRIDANTWAVEATSAQLAKLVASPDGGIRKQTDEGAFAMPFRFVAVK